MLGMIAPDNSESEVAQRAVQRAEIQTKSVSAYFKACLSESPRTEAYEVDCTFLNAEIRI